MAFAAAYRDVEEDEGAPAGGKGIAVVAAELVWDVMCGMVVLELPVLAVLLFAAPFEPLFRLG